MASALVDAAGPFLIPVVLFGLGLVGYLFLFLLTRWGILGD
jgi:hypothetical protein